MRPKPLPPFTGVSYRHVGYRLYARFHPAHGRAIEGLYFVRSACDSRPMSVGGNVVTDFNFHTAPIRINEEEDGAVEINVDSPDAPARARLLRRAAPELPAHSAFGSLEEAKAFLKYEPYGLSPADKGGANVVHITRDEERWRSRLVRVGEESWSFFEGREVLPEVCDEVEPIEYQWDRARIYRPFGA